MQMAMSCDFRCKSVPMTSMTAYVSGAELRDIHDHWIAKREFLTVPPLDPSLLEAERLYHIVLPHELVIKLGSRKKLLTNVAEGPAVTPEEVLREIFLE